MQKLMIMLAIFSNALCASGDACEHKKSTVSLETLELTICLIPSESSPEMFQAIQRSYKNISKEPITLLIENHETYKFEMRMRQGKNDGLTNRKLIWGGDMEDLERGRYTSYILESENVITFEVQFNKFKRQVKKVRGVEMQLPFSMYFRFPQTYLRSDERGDYVDAMRARIAEQNIRKNFPNDIKYDDVYIDWQ